MPEPGSKAELMRSLRCLVSGLSLLFWALPGTLLVSLESGVSELLQPLGVFPPVAGHALLLYGLWQLARFQPTERIWRRALERSALLGIINAGLSPFIFWSNRMPNETIFTASVGVLAVSGVLFVFNLNFVLQRLAAMLPDQGLRGEIRLFTRMNLALMAGMLTLLALYFGLVHWVNSPSLPAPLAILHDLLIDGRRFLLVFFILLPVALTMSLIWKTKELVLGSVFDQSG